MRASQSRGLRGPCVGGGRDGRRAPQVEGTARACGMRPGGLPGAPGK